MPESENPVAELPLDSIGARLKRTREGLGLSLSAIAERTKIPERNLIAIEEGRFGDLPARMYAIGFSRSFAREVGLDEVEVADAVRAEMKTAEGDHDGRPAASTFEPGDAARVPPLGLALIAGLAALAVVLGGLIVWRSYWAPGVSLPSLAPEESASAVAMASPASGAPAAIAPGAAQGGAVVFTALEPGVWVKFYDAGGVQLMQKLLAQGESYTVPADAQGPQVWTARPEALAITIGGRTVAKLSDQQVTMKDVPVSAAALLARAPSAPAVSPAATVSAAVREAPRSQRVSRDPRIGQTAGDVAMPVEPVASPSAAPAQPSTVSE